MACELALSGDGRTRCQDVRVTISVGHPFEGPVPSLKLREDGSINRGDITTKHTITTPGAPNITEVRYDPYTCVEVSSANRADAAVVNVGLTGALTLCLTLQCMARALALAKEAEHSEHT